MKKSTKSTEVKERIIEVTIALIQASNGNAAEITTRDIAEKAEVGNGLINYHFQTKENLIAICVQRIIGKVVDSFKPNLANCQSVEEQMTCAATKVFEFLFQNPAISRISILGDFSKPDENSNTVKSQHSFSHVLGESMEDADKQVFTFVLTSSMQAAFLAHQFGDAILGYKLDTAASRQAFIEKLIDMLFHGIMVEKND
ncbi:MAG: TetR/AcrR family transcriptional regulator [Oscillospiraceae bacterium]